MTPKSFFVLAVWGLAALLFFLVGFDIVNESKYDLVAIGLGSLTVGFIVNTFVTG